MTIHVELSPEAEERLVAEARSFGVSPEKVAERLLHDALALRSKLGNSLSIEEFHVMLGALATGSEALPPLPTESFSRDSFYQGED